MHFFNQIFKNLKRSWRETEQAVFFSRSISNRSSLMVSLFFFFNCSYQPGKGKHWGASSIWPLFVDNITTVWFAVDGKKQYRSCRNVVRPMHGEYIGTIQQNVFHGQKRGNTQNHTATSTSKLSLIRKQ